MKISVLLMLILGMTFGCVGQANKTFIKVDIIAINEDKIIENAKRLIKAKQYKDAIYYLDGPIATNPTSIFYEIRGEARYYISHYSEAIEDINKAIELDSGNSEAYGVRGLIERDLEDLKSAMIDYDRSLELNPRNSIILINRAAIRDRHQDYAGALHDCNAAISIEPSADAFSRRGVTKALMGDYIGSVEDFDQSILLDPKDPTDYSNRAYSRHELGDNGLACEDWAKAYKLGSIEAYGEIKKYCNK